MRAVDRDVKDLFSKTVDRVRTPGYHWEMAKKLKSNGSGQHRTRRLAIQVPDPDDRCDIWRTVAEEDGMTLAGLVQRLLDRHAERKKQKRA